MEPRKKAVTGMSELQHFDKQDLINLQKIASIHRSDDAAYISEDGYARSMYQRKEKGYRIQFKDDDKVYLFVFDEKNKPVQRLIGNIKETTSLTMNKIRKIVSGRRNQMLVEVELLPTLGGLSKELVDREEVKEIIKRIMNVKQ